MKVLFAMIVLNATAILEWVKAVATFLGASALILAYVQLRRTIQWNRLSACLTYLDSVRVAEVEGRLVTALRSVGLNYNDDKLEFTNEKLTEILNNASVYMAIRHFLNMLEFVAAGVHAGALDAEFAYHHRGDFYLRNWKLFEPLVKRVRDEVGNQKYWSETQKICCNWQKRKTTEGLRPIGKRYKTR